MLFKLRIQILIGRSHTIHNTKDIVEFETLENHCRSYIHYPSFQTCLHFKEMQILFGTACARIPFPFWKHATLLHRKADTSHTFLLSNDARPFILLQIQGPGSQKVMVLTFSQEMKSLTQEEKSFSKSLGMEEISGYISLGMLCKMQNTLFLFRLRDGKGNGLCYLYFTSNFLQLVIHSGLGRRPFKTWLAFPRHRPARPRFGQYFQNIFFARWIVELSY